MDLSIIIVNWNTRKMLSNCLRSLQINLFKENSCEIIVVDNGSSDGSVEMVKRNFPSVTLIANKTNLGFVRANNQGAALAKGRYLLLLNSDTVVLDGEMGRIIEYMDAHPDVGVTTGRVLNPDKTFQRPFRRYPNCFGAILRHTVDLIKRLNHPLAKRYKLEHLDELTEHQVHWVTGAYLFLRRDLVEGGRVFDEDLYMYYEDTLLCYRVSKRGYRIMYLPIAPIVHYYGASSSQIRTDAIFNSFRSSVIYFKKVYGKLFAKSYSLTVRIIWGIFAVCFSMLKPIPATKLREKAELFRDLLSRGPV